MVKSSLIWPSGEVETRLSAKQALHRFDSDLGLIFLYFVFSSVDVDFGTSRGYTWRNSAQADFFMKWKEISTNIGIRVLSTREAPLLLKEGAWRLINVAVKCGKSNPVSFVLRPVFNHKKLRVGLGLSLATIAIVATVLAPSSLSAGENTGGNTEMILRPIGDTVLTTQRAVRIPIEHYQISQGFWSLHPGIDMASTLGEPVYALSPGQVTDVEKGWFGYGNYVVIDHGSEYESLYAHMSKITVKEGQEVTTDTKVGEVGSVGHSTGPHLHLEVYQNGVAINPLPILGIK